MCNTLHEDLTSNFPRRNGDGKRGITSRMKGLASLRRLGTVRSLEDMDGGLICHTGLCGSIFVYFLSALLSFMTQIF